MISISTLLTFLHAIGSLSGTYLIDLYVRKDRGFLSYLFSSIIFVSPSNRKFFEGKNMKLLPVRSHWLAVFMITRWIPVVNLYHVAALMEYLLKRDTVDQRIVVDLNDSTYTYTVTAEEAERLKEMGFPQGSYHVAHYYEGKYIHSCHYVQEITEDNLQAPNYLEVWYWLTTNRGMPISLVHLEKWEAWEGTPMIGRQLASGENPEEVTKEAVKKILENASQGPSNPY